jgi:hypothetical protein
LTLLSPNKKKHLSLLSLLTVSLTISLQVLQNVSDNRKQPPNAADVKLSPPKPPRSAFMCFTDAKKKDIMSQHGIRKV